jgi:hypothetical protein
MYATRVDKNRWEGKQILERLGRKAKNKQKVEALTQGTHTSNLQTIISNIGGTSGTKNAYYSWYLGVAQPKQLILSFSS